MGKKTPALELSVNDNTTGIKNRGNLPTSNEAFNAAQQKHKLDERLRGIFYEVGPNVRNSTKFSWRKLSHRNFIGI
jgi:hypothetical protein